MKKKSITLRGHLVPYASYGRLLQVIANGLSEKGYHVKIFPIQMTEGAWGSSVPDNIKKMVVSQPQQDDWEVILSTPMEHVLSLGDADKALFTLWETSKLKPEVVKHINDNVEVVITPSIWNYEVFDKSGIKVPLFLSPLGVDTNLFVPHHEEFPKTDIITFGTAARMQHGGVRKGVYHVVEAFKKAFPFDDNVRLRIKAFPDCPLPDSFYDSRIEVLKAYLDDESLVLWYRSLNAFVSGSCSEGWGLHQQEAMCCGVPVVGANYGGVNMFFNPPDNGYAVSYDEVEVPESTLEGKFEGYFNSGKWASLSTQSLVANMQMIKNNPVGAYRKGIVARDCASGYGEQNMVDSFEETLKDIGVI